jgi:hypothetical protein
MVTVGIRVEMCIALIVASRDISNKSASNSRERTHDSTIGTINLSETVTTVIMSK